MKLHKMFSGEIASHQGHLVYERCEYVEGVLSTRTSRTTRTTGETESH